MSDVTSSELRTALSEMEAHIQNAWHQVNVTPLIRSTTITEDFGPDTKVHSEPITKDSWFSRAAGLFGLLR